jgi:hypothetical protein
MHTQEHASTQLHSDAREEALQQFQPSQPGWFEKLFSQLHVPGEIRLPNGSTLTIGSGTPRFHVTVHNEKLLWRPHDELSLGQAYVNGELDLEGDMLAIL